MFYAVWKNVISAENYFQFRNWIFFINRIVWWNAVLWFLYWMNTFVIHEMENCIVIIVTVDAVILNVYSFGRRKWRLDVSRVWQVRKSTIPFVCRIFDFFPSFFCVRKECVFVCQPVLSILNAESFLYSMKGEKEFSYFHTYVDIHIYYTFFN